jgi:glycine hydroxymethyltransferase
MHPEFKTYQEQVVKNARVLASTLMENGLKLVSSGTDNHLVLIDLSGTEITGKDAEQALGLADITVNKNTVPFETRSPFITSGVRIGTPAITSRGMKEKDMVLIGSLISEIISNMGNEAVIKKVRNKVRDLCESYPLYKGVLF